MVAEAVWTPTPTTPRTPYGYKGGLDAYVCYIYDKVRTANSAKSFQNLSKFGAHKYCQNLFAMSCLLHIRRWAHIIKYIWLCMLLVVSILANYTG